MFIAVFTFFYKLIILPLSDAIRELKDMIQDIRKDLRTEREVRNRFEIRLSIIEEKIHRLEGAGK